MDAKTVNTYENLSSRELFLEFLSASNKELVKKIKLVILDRVNDGAVSDPLCAALVSTTNARDRMEGIHKNSLKCKLYKDAIEYVGKVSGFEGTTKNESTIEVVRRRVSVLCLAIERLYDISKIGTIDIDAWHKLVSELKDGDKSSYKDELSEHYKVATRRLAMLLEGAHSDHRFKVIASSKRIRSQHAPATLEEIAIKYEDFNKWLELWDEYLNTLHIKSTKNHVSSAKLFLQYILKYNLSHNPFKYLSKYNVPTYWDFMIEDKIADPAYKLRIVYEFTNWVIDNHMTDTEDGESVTIGVPIMSSHAYSRAFKSAPKYIKPAESVKLAPPTSWLFLMKDILTEDNFKWPKSIENEHINFYNKETEKSIKVWCPVNTFIFLTMLELPIRKIQVISSDSGEGDTHKYDIKSRKWIKNDSIHAGRWKKMGAKRVNRGIVCKIPSTDPSFAGFYINTNKTQDIDNGFSELSGYSIPWSNETLIQYLSDLRDWQEKYNPVAAPTKYKVVAKPVFQTSPTKSVLEVIPDRFYLFRHPNTYRGHFPDAPPTTNQINYFWHRFMEELEKRLNELGENVEIITHRNEKTGYGDAAIFTPHGLRVAGLTAFAEAGVPIEVLSKIVAGHSSILMTIYYIKYNAAHITDILNDAQRNVELNAQKNFQQWLKNASWEEAKRFTAYNTTDGLDFACKNKVSSAVWGGSCLGICPHAGTKCHDGGPVIRKNSANKKPNNVYGAVPGGQGNCVRCRHFITGTPWLIPLWLHGNKLLSDTRKQSIELDELKSENEQCCAERYNYIKSGKPDAIPPELVKRINTNDSNIESKAKALDETLLSCHATYNLLEKVRAIASGNINRNINEGTIDKDHHPLILVSDEAEIGFEETTRFIEVDALVQAGRVYNHVRDKDEERERNNFIDQIMFNNNMTPISFSPLTDAEKSLASDDAAKFLIARLSANEIENLHDGHITLDSLGISSDLEKMLGLVQKPQSLGAPSRTDTLALESTKDE